MIRNESMASTISNSLTIATEWVTAKHLSKEIKLKVLIEVESVINGVIRSLLSKLIIIALLLWITQHMIRFTDFYKNYNSIT